MKQLSVIIISVLVLVFGSASTINASSRSENNRLLASAGVYIHVKAMKWQRGRDVGTVTVKIDPNKGKALYNGKEIVVRENPDYVSWDDPSKYSDPRCKYQWYSYVTSYETASFYLYFNYD